MSHPLAHEKLHVYDKALAFTGYAISWTTNWDPKHAVVDQVSRAAESMVLNLAEAARQCGRPARLRATDFALGSSLECAGCVDIAGIKGLVPRSDCIFAKRALSEITRMIVGLRKAWAGSVLQEEYVTSHIVPTGPAEAPLFHHERLEVYKAGLGFVEWFVSQPAGKALVQKGIRRIDEAATSIVLNIAEGNGRFAELDHRRFMEMADAAAIKAAVYIDLCVKRDLLQEREATAGKVMLRRISLMTAGF